MSMPGFPYLGPARLRQVPRGCAETPHHRRHPDLLCLLLILVPQPVCHGCGGTLRDDLADAPLATNAKPRVRAVGPAKQNAPPQLLHDFGVVRPREVVSHVFEIKNDTERSWTISNVSRNCSCTVTSLSTSVIKPHNAAKLTVTYTAPAVRADDRKAIAVTFREKIPPLRLIIEARVRALLEVSAPDVVISGVAANSIATTYLTVENFGDSNWSSLAATVETSWLVATTRQLARRTQDASPREAWEVAMQANAQGLAIGGHDTALYISADDAEPTRVPVKLIVTSPVTVIPSRIFLGRVTAGRSYVRSIQVRFARNSTVEPGSLTVRSSAPDSVTASLKKATSSTSEFEVTIAPAMATAPAMLKEHLIIEFGKTGPPPITVPLSAIVQTGTDQDGADDF